MAPDKDMNNPRTQPTNPSENKMDRPLPGSGDPPTPKPVATGFSEPIEESARATEGDGKGKTKPAP